MFNAAHPGIQLDWAIYTLGIFVPLDATTFGATATNTLL